MRENLTPAMVFTTNGQATPSHDKMLILFNKDSTRLRNICLEIIKEEFEKYEQDAYYIVTPSGELGLTKDRTFISGFDNFDNKLYINKSVQEQFYIDQYKEGLSLFQFKEDIKNKKIEEVITYQHIKNKVIFEEPTLKILDWKPEEPIIKGGSYYIGSVDLLVTFETPMKGDLPVVESKQWNNFVDTIFKKQIVFEFKPEIKSFSEVIRQVNVYRHHFSEAKFYVVTYSNVDEFFSIFKEQKIDIIKLEKQT